MTDFRALCAELHAAFNTYAVDEPHHDLLVRARAALAQLKPQEPTDEELMNLWTEWNVSWDISQGIWNPIVTPHPAEYARAVLARFAPPLGPSRRK